MSLATQPFHSSVRTAISKNRDPLTGEQTQLLTTSQLELNWRSGELEVRCKVSRVALNGARVERITRRPNRA